MKSTKSQEIKYRVIALLSKEELQFLEKFSMDSLFSTGHKLSKIDIISGLVEAARQMNISGNGIKNKNELIEQILSKVRGREADRRAYPRVKKGLMISLRKADSLNEYKDCLTKNVSLGGFMIEVEKLEESYAVAQLIELTIKDKEPVKALGRICWMNEKEDKSGWQMGIQLIYIKEEDAGTIQNALEKI